MRLRLNRPVLFTAVFLTTLLLTACQTEEPPPGTPVGNQPAATTQSIDGEPFDIVMSVLTSPRCSNCHPTADQPLQRDEQIPHLFNVTRGEENHAGPVQTCDTCHHEENNLYSNVPGAPHWGLAPQSMGWHGLTDAEVVAALLDPAKNGGRTHEDLLHHMSEDPLVLWAWEPGNGRTPPPVSHEQFIQSLEAWLAAGALIPTETE
ncbi:hypothetical protein [Candidatus Leptofilum sp.]|uniref:hypothetical protein n=1 Tax=Candidatus Leptofilum sp. TaxID=3241576 RepID=UPI003B5BDC49